MIDVVHRTRTPAGETARPRVAARARRATRPRGAGSRAAPNAEQQERHDRGEDLEGDRARVGEQVVLDVGVDERAQLGARRRGALVVVAATRLGYPVPARLGSAVVTADAHQRWTLRVVCVSTALLLLNVAAPQVALAAIADVAGRELHRPAVGAQRLRARARRASCSPPAAWPTASAAGSCSWSAWRCSAPPRRCARSRPSPSALIAARLVQGVGAAVVFPSSLAILAEEFQGAERRRAIGAWGATIGLAFAAGPLIGGLLVDLFGWRAVFAASVVLGAPTIALRACATSRESRDPDPPPVDWAGVGTLSAGLFARRVRRAARQRSSAGRARRCSAAWRLRRSLLRAFVAVERAHARARCSTCALFRNRTFSGRDAGRRAAGRRHVRRRSST